MMESWGSIISILSTLTVGGIIGTIISLRYLPKKESAKAQQEVEQVESMDINNTSNLVSLYRQALDDLRDRYSKNESELKKIISDYEEKLNKAEETLKSYEEEINRYKKITDQLLKSHLKLRTLIQTIDPEELETILADINIDDEING